MTDVNLLSKFLDDVSSAEDLRGVQRRHLYHKPDDRGPRGFAFISGTCTYVLLIKSRKVDLTD